MFVKLYGDKMTDQQEDMIECEECNEQLKEKDLGITFIYTEDCDLVCRNCAYKILDRKCIKCKCFFNSLSCCPDCEEDEHIKRYGRKATKKDIDNLFDDVLKECVG